jgi:hypothetical protein
MDLRKLQFCFKVGSFLTLTPPSLTSLKPTVLERFYVSLVFLLYTIATICNKLQKKQFYPILSSVQLIFHLMVDLILGLHTCYCLVLLLTTRRRQWFKLVNGLSRIERFSTSNTNNWRFVVALVIFAAASISTTSLWMYLVGWLYFKIYVIEYVQVYTEFFYMVLACTILNMVLERYKSQSCLMRDQIKFGKKTTKDVVKLLKQVKLNVFMLKEAVDAFNEIFGWVILLNIFFGCSKGLSFLYNLLESESSSSEDSIGVVVFLSFTKHCTIVTYCVRFTIFIYFFFNHSVLDCNCSDPSVV